MIVKIKQLVVTLTALPGEKMLPLLVSMNSVYFGVVILCNHCHTEQPEDACSQSSISSLSNLSSATNGSQSPTDAGSFSSITQSSSTDTNGHEVVPSSQWSRSMLEAFFTYKLIGDNLDKRVTPRDMRLDHQAQSLHYFNCYTVKDRVSTLGLEDNPSLPDFLAFSETKILPTAKDHEALKNNFVSRVVKKNFTFFSKFGTGVPKHVKHKYYAEMTKKSEVVSRSALICIIFNCQ